MNKTILLGVFIVLALVVGRIFFPESTLRSYVSGISENKENFKIGAALGLTGDAAAWGEASRNAILLAQDEINAQGGINGKKLDIVIEDMKSSSKDSVTAVSRLVNVDKVHAVMITWLDSYQGSESVVPKTIPLISQDAAIESVNTPISNSGVNPNSNVFSLWYRTSSKAKVTIDEMVKSNVKTLYLVTQNDSYYSTLVQFLTKEAESRGIRIVGAESLNAGGDARTVISKVQSARPDAVFFGAYDEKLSVDFPKRWHELGAVSGKAASGQNHIVFYADEFLEQSIESKKVDPSWFDGAKYYVPARSNPDFAAKYKARFGVEPMFSAVNTYDTVYVLAKYLKDNPQDLNSYMTNTTFDTLTYGSIKFDSIGGVVSDKTAIVMKQVREGRLENI